MCVFTSCGEIGGFRKCYKCKQYIETTKEKNIIDYIKAQGG